MGCGRLPVGQRRCHELLKVLCPCAQLSGPAIEEGGESVDDLESDDLTGDRGTEICARPVSQELVSHRGGGMDPSETESAPHGLAERSDTDRSWCCRQATVVVGEYDIGKGVVLDDDGAGRHEFGGQLGVPIRVCGCAGRPVDSGHEKDSFGFERRSS